MAADILVYNNTHATKAITSTIVILVRSPDNVYSLHCVYSVYSDNTIDQAAGPPYENRLTASRTVILEWNTMEE